QQQRRRQPAAVLQHEEAGALIVRTHRQHATEQLHGRIFLRMHLQFRPLQHLHAREDKESTENVDDPVKGFQQHGPQQDERGAHDESAENAPEQRTMLRLRRNREVPEDEQEYEDVVDAERVLDQIAGQEFEAPLAPEGAHDPDVECSRERDPDDRPRQRLLSADGVRVAVEQPQIEREQSYDECGESNPEYRRADAVHAKTLLGGRPPLFSRQNNCASHHLKLRGPGLRIAYPNAAANWCPFLFWKRPSEGRTRREARAPLTRIRPYGNCKHLPILRRLEHRTRIWN